MLPSTSLAAAFLSAGQKCTATSRVIVEARVVDEFADLLVGHAQSWSVGDPLDAATRVGLLASSSQLENVERYLQTARADGGTFLAGGSPADLGPGYFVRPTVVAGLAPASAVVREEIFGPVAALLPADSFEGALDARERHSIWPDRSRLHARPGPGARLHGKPEQASSR